MTTATAEASVGEKIRAVRMERGLSLADVAFEIRVRHGRKVTAENLRLYEVGRYGVTPMLFAELADVLDFSPKELSPELADDLRRQLRLLKQLKIDSRCNPLDPGPDGGGGGIPAVVIHQAKYHGPSNNRDVLDTMPVAGRILPAQRRAA